MDKYKKEIEALYSNRAMIKPSTVNEEDRTVEIVFATSMPARMYSWSIGDFMETLSMEKKAVNLERMKLGAPLLDNHSRFGSVADDVLGVVEKAWLEGEEAKALVRFSKSEKGEKVFQDVKDGILKNISVGYRVYEYEKVSENKGELPVMRAINWEPFEVSIVAVPADHKAQVKSEKELLNEVTITQINREMEQNEKDPTKVVTTPIVDVEAERRLAAKEAVEQERLRAFAIKEAAEKAGIDSKFTDELIKKGLTVDQSRLEIIEEWRRLDTTVDINNNVTVGKDETVKERAAIEAALSVRGSQVIKLTDEERTLAKSYQNLSLMDLAKERLEKVGVNTRLLSAEEIIKRSITSSTSDFPILLENTLNKVLMNAYENTPDTWSRFCSIGRFEDFRPHPKYKMSSIGDLVQVPENGEYPKTPLYDGEKELVQGATYGMLIDLSRQMIINDDLGVFLNAGAALGRSSRRTIEKAVYALLLANPLMSDGNALYDATHANTLTGASISTTALELMQIAMRSQVDPSGKETLDILPSVLVTPLAIGNTARTIVGAEFDQEETNAYGKPNRIRNFVSDVVDSPFLTGNAYFLFANPMINPAIEVSFLKGVQTPYTVMEESFNQDGVRWKIRHDWAVGAIDWRATNRNPGA